MHDYGFPIPSWREVGIANYEFSFANKQLGRWSFPPYWLLYFLVFIKMNQTSF